MAVNAWWLAGVLSSATPSPNPTPGLREGLDESVISPGLAGFLAVFGVALASLVLFYSLTGKLRGVKHRGELAEAGEVATSAGGLPAGELRAGEPREGRTTESEVPDGGARDGDPAGGGAPGRELPDGGTSAPEQPGRP